MEKKETIWNPAFINLIVIYFIMSMSQMMMQTLIPKYAAYLGAEATIVGTVASIFAVTALAIRPVASPAFDSFSKKKLLAISMVIITISFVGYSQAKTIPFIIAARLLHGIGVGCSGPLCLALASDALPQNKFGSGIAIFSLGMAMAQAIGPSAGLKLLSLFGYNSTFWIGAVIMGLACILIFILKEKETVRSKYVITLERIIAKEALRPAIIVFFLSTSFACIMSFMVIYGGIRGINNIGLYFTVYALSLFITRPLFGNLGDKYGFDKVLMPGIICFALSFVIVSMADKLWLFLLAAVVAAMGFGICQPTIQAICMKSVPKERRGAAGNTNYIGMDCGMIAGPILAGIIIDTAKAASLNEASAYSLMFLFMTVPMIFAFIFFIMNKKRILTDSRKYENLDIDVNKSTICDS